MFKTKQQQGALPPDPLLLFLNRDKQKTSNAQDVSKFTTRANPGCTIWRRATQTIKDAVRRQPLVCTPPAPASDATPMGRKGKNIDRME